MKKNLLPLFALLFVPFTGTYFNNVPVVVSASEEYPELTTSDSYIEYWENNVRPEANTSICDMEQTLFEHLYTQYQMMPTSEKNKLDNFKDKSGSSIKETLLFLNSFFHPVGHTQSNKTTLESDITLTVIVSVACFGMTAIGLFYVLKNKKFIE